MASVHISERIAPGGDENLQIVGRPVPRITAYSGLTPLVGLLGGGYIEMNSACERIRAHSWRMGEWARNWSVRHYGSAWTSMLPFWSDWQVLCRLPRTDGLFPVHFWWGEFIFPKRVEPYHRRGARVVVSVHCSARRWDSVWLRPDGYARADQVVLTSESQRPFVERDVPRERVCTILHGVVADYFSPPAARRRGDKLRMFMLGDTERDHAFAAEVAARLPSDRFEWRIRTTSPEKAAYAGSACVNLLPRLSDAEMLAEYQQADVLAMPMLDSAANNAILESMACGTPVMVNRVGGVPEYVEPGCNFVMGSDRDVDAWVEKLLWMERNRDEVERMRPATRAWAERFDWRLMAREYREMYRQVLARG
jgi:glycosyltransferase involved in cell wall biosynthesis